MKKKFSMLIAILCCAILAFALCACDLGSSDGTGDIQIDTDPTSITLDVDKNNSANFAGKIALTPITGDTLDATADAGNYEKVTITATATTARKLLICFTDVTETIPDLMITVNGGTPIKFVNNVTLYESTEDETAATLNVCVYLSKDAEASVSAGKSLNFSIEVFGYEA